MDGESPAQCMSLRPLILQNHSQPDTRTLFNSRASQQFLAEKFPRSSGACLISYSARCIYLEGGCTPLFAGCAPHSPLPEPPPPVVFSLCSLPLCNSCPPLPCPSPVVAPPQPHPLWARKCLHSDDDFTVPFIFECRGWDHARAADCLPACG